MKGSDDMSPKRGNALNEAKALHWSNYQTRKPKKTELFMAERK